MQEQKNKIHRGEILRVLYRSMPLPVCDNVLNEVFHWNTPAYILTQLNYLEQKKYIRIEEVEEKYSTAKFIAHILPMGVDLLEHSIRPEPGIVLPKI